MTRIILLHGDLFDFDSLLWLIAFDFRGRNLVDHIETLDDLCNRNVLAVKGRVVFRGDEEVPASRAVRRYTHRHRTALLLHGNVLLRDRPGAEDAFAVRTVLRPVSKKSDF